MIKCTQCGSEYEGNFCPNCGASENPYTQPQSMPDQKWSGAGVYPQYVQGTHITTTLEWLGWVLLTYFLPVIGVIIMFCCAPGKSAKNFAKLHLILYAIAVVLTIIGLAVFFGVLGGSLSRR